MLKTRSGYLARLTVMLALFTTLAFVTGCSRDPNKRKQKYLESGKRYEESGKYKEASIQFFNALKVDRNFADAHFELAKTYLKLNNPAASYPELAKTVELNPQNLEARIDLGNLLLAGGFADRAEVQAKAVLSLNINDADGYALLAGIAQNRHDSAEAIKDMKQAITLDPKRSAFHSAMALLQANDPAAENDAEQELTQAVTLDPKSATPHLLLGQLLSRKGNVQGAQQQFEAAVSADPKNLQARGALASIYFSNGDKSKAEQVLHQAVVDNPEADGASSMLAQFYGRTAQPDRAESTFADLVAKFPKSFPIKMTYARILFDRKEYDKAKPVVDQLTKSDAGNPAVQTLNALLLINTGKTDDALTLLKKSVKDYPNYVQTRMLLAKVAASKGDLPTAETNLREAARLNPGNEEAASGLADIAVRRNDAGMLSEIADKTIQTHPDFVDAYLWRGVAESSRKEYDKAEADFQTVLKKAPESPTVYFELGKLRLAQGHTADGLAMMQKALDKNPNFDRALGTLVAYDLQAKQQPKAVARVQAQIAKAPNNGNMYSQLAILQLQTKDFQGALQSSQKAMQLNPADAGAVQVYTQAQVSVGNLDSAISTWQTWQGAHPSDPRAPAILGALEEAKGDQAKAIDDYKKTLQLDSNNAVAANNLAFLMVENNQNVDVALSLAQTARRILPDSPQTADTLAWVYYFKGNYGASRDLLENALKSSPDDAEIHYHLGMTYTKLNDKSNAQLHLKKASTLSPGSRAGKEASAALSKLS